MGSLKNTGPTSIQTNKMFFARIFFFYSKNIRNAKDLQQFTTTQNTSVTSVFSGSQPHSNHSLVKGGKCRRSDIRTWVRCRGDTITARGLAPWPCCVSCRPSNCPIRSGPCYSTNPGHPDRETHVRWRRPSDGEWLSVRRSERLMREWRPNCKE